MLNIYFTDIMITPKFPSSMLVQWEVNNQSVPDNYFFNLYVSSNPELEYRKVNTIPIVNAYYYEFPVELLFKEEYYWCKVELVINGQTVISKPQSFFNDVPRQEFLIIQEIMRKKELLRRKKVGIKCQIRKRRVFGNLCTRCIEKGTGISTDSRCPICYGTRVIGGFYAPIENWVEIVENPRNLIPSEIGTLNDVIAVGSITYPIVQKGDVIIEDTRNKRWYVNGIQRELLRSFPIDQKVELRQIAPKDIEYSL